jgi:hypothetical protein
VIRRYVSNVGSVIVKLLKGEMKNFVKIFCVLIDLYFTEILVGLFGYQHIKVSKSN